MILKVAKGSVPSSVAGYLASKIRAADATKRIVVQAVGEQAVEHAVNTMVLARRYLKIDQKTGASGGVQLDFVCTPSFATITTGEKTTSALQFLIIPA